jgi:hypothetical protein
MKPAPLREWPGVRSGCARPRMFLGSKKSSKNSWLGLEKLLTRNISNISEIWQERDHAVFSGVFLFLNAFRACDKSATVHVAEMPGPSPKTYGAAPCEKKRCDLAGMSIIHNSLGILRGPLLHKGESLYIPPRVRNETMSPKEPPQTPRTYHSDKDRRKCEDGPEEDDSVY